MTTPPRPEPQTEPEPAPPVMALPYQPAAADRSPEAGLVVLAAVAAATVGLLSFATMVIIAAAPGLFRNVGSHEWPSVGFVFYVAHASAGTAVVAGGLAYLAGWRRGAALLLAGSAAAVLFQLGDFVYSVLTGGRSSNRTVGDAVVTFAWHVTGLVANSVVPLLTVAVFWRTRRAGGRPGGGG